MTKDEIIKYLAEIPEGVLDLVEENEILHNVMAQARVLQPREGIKLRHIYLEKEWMEYVAAVPIYVQGDVVNCWIGDPHRAQGLTLHDLTSCQTHAKTVRFFNEHFSLRAHLDGTPF